ncbi:MAG TPA: SWIM zinc finger family protein, partial [Candidatus Sutterella merdavium]|nr:SWIM zinc finger family protein [Candidatus Sutterella merdavium]
MAPRTKFGETWWGNEWLKSLAKIDHANRLPRGRTYFNTGNVESLEWHAEDHEIYATVSGSAYFPYEITIGIPPAKEANVEKLVEATAERPDLCAELLAGRLPAELNDLALAAGVELFPTSWRSFRMRCSCPDSAVPCKHLAAVIYAVSKYIDEDPFWVFTFRGINLVERLKAYGVRLDETSSVSIPKWEDYAARVRAEKPEAVPEEEEALALLQNLPFAALPKMGELLSSLLGDAQPYFLPKTFRADLAKLRKTLRKTASDRLAALTATDDDIRIPEAAPAKLRLGGRRRFEWTKEASADWETIYGLPFASVRRAPAPVAAWHAAHVAMLQLVAHDAYAPVLFAGGMMEDEGRSAEVFFVPAVGSPAVRTLLETLGRGLSPFLPAMLAGKGRAKCRVTDPSEAALSIVTKLLADFLTVPALKLFQTPESAFFAGLNANELPRAPFYDDAEPFVVQVADWLSPYFLASRAWTPVLTVRSGKEGDVTLNFGVLEEEKKDNAKALPVLLRTILKEERWEKERYGV